MEHLSILLNDIIPAIKGKWCLWGGGLLGLHRSGKFIDGDNDLDIILFDDAYIDYNLLDKESIGSQNYYMNQKIYRKGKKIFKPKNKWIEYCSFIRMKDENKGKNRAEVLRIASNTYSQDYIKPEFTECFIDVEYIKEKDDRYTPQYFRKCYFEKKEIDNIIYKQYGNMSIPIPSNLDIVCERHFGKNWRIPDPAWKY
tara:strand:- start:4188 stop:4781 length:594 start_codon:yes stop_codon:yes gene_type:complete